MCQYQRVFWYKWCQSSALIFHGSRWPEHRLSNSSGRNDTLAKNVQKSNNMLVLNRGAEKPTFYTTILPFEKPFCSPIEISFIAFENAEKNPRPAWVVKMQITQLTALNYAYNFVVWIFRWGGVKTVEKLFWQIYFPIYLQKKYQSNTVWIFCSWQHFIHRSVKLMMEHLFRRKKWKKNTFFNICRWFDPHTDFIKL